MKRQALVIGINEYLHLTDLKSAANDAEAIATILEEQGNFEVTRLPSCKDENNRERVHPRPDSQKAMTLRRLTDKIKNFFNPQGEQIPEIALLFFAGHGLVNEEFGEYHNFLATVDTDPESEIWGYHLDKLQKSLKFSKIPEKIVWLDACHSGALIRDFESQSNTKWCLISAAPDHDVAKESQRQGVLTAALLKALDYQKNKSTSIDSHTLVKNLEEIRKTEGITQKFQYKNSEQSILLTGQHLTVKDERLQGVCPYKGLLYFDSTYPDFLFYKGRTTLTAQLLDKVIKQRFVAVLGASGSGKSSLVRAGLIHTLEKGENVSGYWQILPIIRPGVTPLVELTTVVAKVEKKYSEHLLIIDQFEEVFTLCQDDKQQIDFFEQLLALTDLYVVIVMRADFFAHCFDKPYAGLGDKIKNNLFTITPMTAEELKQAIEEPAEKVGFRVQDSLTLEIIQDIENSPGNLPLLQYTLEKVFQAQDASQQLTLAAYKQLSGIKGALASKADEIYQSFSEPEQETVKWLFLELTQLGEGQEDTRKQLTLPELKKNLAHRNDLLEVIDKLTTERLLIQDKNSSNVTIVDVAHEALIREWARLRRWLTESRSALTKKREIEPAAEDWEVHRKSKDYLWQGPKLAMAEDYVNNDADKVPLSDLAQEFVRKSIKYRQKKRYSLIGVVTAVILVLAGIAFYANGQRIVANERRDSVLLTQSSLLTNLAERETEKGNTTKGTLLALEALPKDMSNPDKPYLPKAEEALYNSVVKPTERLVLKHDNLVEQAIFSPNGNYILTSSGYSNSYLWDAHTGDLIATPNTLPNDEIIIRHIVFSPDSKYVITIESNSPDDVIHLWNIHTGKEPVTFKSFGDISDVTFSPNGQHLITISDRNAIFLWDIKTGKLLNSLKNDKKIHLIILNPG
ncbi:caspase family protein [Candidatus Parabeggiatoa sp. HSG14]|uniref:nSTAND1 domain-containing NTPase n=1 Tax=Candidatus Parabeggiatoa sp. HSG14 TaxID=3055593 RepID=UPI0025A8AF48|nr:caspase family protein [Thiotrichales bacterium HSG14]